MEVIIIIGGILFFLFNQLFDLDKVDNPDK
jgi:hypothetical protein